MSNRPTVAPDWATDANFPAGSDDWSGQSNKVQPSAGKIASGIAPDEDFYAEWLNWILNNHGSWIDYLVGSYDGRERDIAIIEDDFTGAALDTGKWLNTASAGLTFVNVDPAIGCAHFDTNAGASASILSQTFKPGTLDFHLTFILKPTGLTSGSYDSLVFGLVNLGSENDTIWFRISRAPSVTRVIRAAPER